MTVEDLETRLRQAFAVRAETTTNNTDIGDRAVDGEDRVIVHRTLPMASVADHPSRRTLAAVGLAVAAVLVAGILIVGSRRDTHQGVLSSASNPPCTSPTSPNTPNSVTITNPAPAPEAPVADPQRPLLLPSLPGTCISLVSGPRDAQGFVIGDTPAVWVDCSTCEQPSKAIKVDTVPVAGADSQQTTPDTPYETVVIEARRFFYIPNAPYWSELRPADLTMATVELVGWGASKEDFIALATAALEGSDIASIAGMTRVQNRTDAPTSPADATSSAGGLVSVIVKYRKPDGTEIIFYYDHYAAAPTLLSTLPYSRNARYITTPMGPAFTSDAPGLHSIAIQPDSSTLIRIASTNDSVTSTDLLAIPLQATTVGGKTWAELVAAAKASGSYNN